MLFNQGKEEEDWNNAVEYIIIIMDFYLQVIEGQVGESWEKMKTPQVQWPEDYNAVQRIFIWIRMRKKIGNYWPKGECLYFKFWDSAGSRDDNEILNVNRTKNMWDVTRGKTVWYKCSRTCEPYENWKNQSDGCWSLQDWLMFVCYRSQNPE